MRLNFQKLGFLLRYEFSNTIEFSVIAKIRDESAATEMAYCYHKILIVLLDFLERVSEM